MAIDTATTMAPRNLLIPDINDVHNFYENYRLDKSEDNYQLLVDKYLDRKSKYIEFKIMMLKEYPEEPSLLNRFDTILDKIDKIILKNKNV